MADTAGASTESGPAPVAPDLRVPSYIATVTSVLMGRPSAIVHVISVSSTVTWGPVQATVEEQLASAHRVTPVALVVAEGPPK